MALTEFVAQLDQLATEADASFANATDAESIEKVRIDLLGAKAGRLRAVQKQLGTLEKADKPAGGQHFNQIKKRIEAALAAARQALQSADTSRQQTQPFDPTLPGLRPRIGRLHPLTQTIEELKDILGRLGFNVVEGPEIEDEWHNFEALNIPPAHPARDPLENFYVATAARTADKRAGKDTSAAPHKPLLLRTQTSTVQIRVMENTPPPVRIISLGRVYRPDTADDTHYPMFNQIEGLLVDRNVTMADLKSTLRTFVASFLGGDVHIRFRTSFFPFTEPSVEVDMSWGDRWIELGGAGMVDPNVLQSVGYDPEKVSGFAFGLGVERICARRHNVTDIREFYKNDVRFLRQF